MFKRGDISILVMCYASDVSDMIEEHQSCKSNAPLHKNKTPTV